MGRSAGPGRSARPRAGLPAPSSSHRYWLAGGGRRCCPVAYHRSHPSRAGKVSMLTKCPYQWSDWGVLDGPLAPPVSGRPSSASRSRSQRYWPAGGGRRGRGSRGPPSAFVRMCCTSLVLVCECKSWEKTPLYVQCAYKDTSAERARLGMLLFVFAFERLLAHLHAGAGQAGASLSTRTSRLHRS